MMRFLNAHPGELFTTVAITDSLDLNLENKRISALLSPVLQLLSQSGKLVRHPDHVHETGERAFMVGVWSDSSGVWKKPEVLNPEMAVLRHAAPQNAGWMFELYANTKGDKSVFCHHTILAAAERLQQRGLITLTKEFMPAGSCPPNGDRAYARVQLTEQGKGLVLPWMEVVVGQSLTRANYDPLRINLVERPSLLDSD